ncbi:MAG: C-terminal helicase domain-containing protein, partial [Candidatus Hydrogenedentes bacterium]|nr:C-terminal helicase domain-containing protein [Candidatus Hydrogenedentota bacterium]
ESAIVFIRTKYRTDRVAKQLNKDGINAQAIHGGRSQSQRERSLDAFRRGKVKVLVATDVAARGIDVPGVTHVFNFDIPKTFDDYVHRIGRTGRAEMTGEALTLVSTQDIRELGDIERGLGKSLVRAEWEGSVHVPSLFSEKGQGQKRRYNQNRPGRGNPPRRRYASKRA